jgi:hypothetical protein
LPSPTADEKLPVGTGSNPVSDKAFISEIIFLLSFLPLHIFFFKLSLQPCFSCVFVEMLKVTFEK